MNPLEEVKKNLAECIDPDNILVKILKRRPLRVYWGTAPTGPIHIGYLVPLLKIAQLIKIGCEIKILIADLHAFLDAKGSWEKLEARTKYYREVIKTILRDVLHVDTSNITFEQGRYFQMQHSYTIDMYKMASHTTLHQAQRAGSDVIKTAANPHMTGLIYPILQALDEEYLDADAQLGGVDQRKIFMFAREMLPKIGYKKRIHLMTPMLPALQSHVEPAEKMSSSTLKGKISVTDSKNVIQKKIRKAYCAEQTVENNCLIDMMEICIFPILDYLEECFYIPRPEKYGGLMKYDSFYSLKADFFSGNLNPIDLKLGIITLLIKLLAPLRTSKILELFRNAYETEEISPVV